MQIERSAEAVWRGDVKSGEGAMSTPSRVLQNTRYSAKTRFENDKQGTNPEEMIAAAHAACFSMALSKMLSDAGQTPREIRTQAKVTMTKTDTGYKISRVHLETVGRVDGVDEANFQKTAEKAKETCPVSQAIKHGVEAITLRATLQK